MLSDLEQPPDSRGQSTRSWRIKRLRGNEQKQRRGCSKHRQRYDKYQSLIRKHRKIQPDSTGHRGLSSTHAHAQIQMSRWSGAHGLPTRAETSRTPNGYTENHRKPTELLITTRHHFHLQNHGSLLSLLSLLL